MLKNIWKCPKIIQISSDNLSEKMKCMWCDTIFLLAHAACMLSHALRVKGTGVQACKGKIPPDAHKQYMMLYQKGKVKSEARKQVSDDVFDIFDSTQQSAMASLLVESAVCCDVLKKYIMSQNK